MDFSCNILFLIFFYSIFLAGYLPGGFVSYFALLQHVYDTANCAKENDWKAEIWIQIARNRLPSLQ